MEQRVADTVVEAVIEALGGSGSGSGSGAVATHLAENTLLHVSGGSGLAGDYQGREAICGLLDRLTTASSGTLRFETVRTSTRGDKDVRFHGKISGQRFERSLATTATFEVTLVGRTIREAWLWCADQPAWDDFWA